MTGMRPNTKHDLNVFRSDVWHIALMFKMGISMCANGDSADELTRMVEVRVHVNNEEDVVVRAAVNKPFVLHAYPSWKHHEYGDYLMEVGQCSSDGNVTPEQCEYKPYEGQYYVPDGSSSSIEFVAMLNEVDLEIATRHWQAFRYASDELRRDRVFAMAVVAIDRRALEYVQGDFARSCVTSCTGGTA